MADGGKAPDTAAPEARGPARDGRGDDHASANPQDRRSAAVRTAAADMVRHAYMACEKECGGNAGRLADMLFEQAKVMATASSLLVDAGCIAIAAGMKRKGAQS
jgi:hypothetical protein